MTLQRRQKQPRQLERHFKGVANHRRIAILLLVDSREGVTLEEIASALDCNLKTISVHVSKLAQAGLLDKKYRGRSVEHALSPYGKKMCEIIRDF